MFNPMNLLCLMIVSPMAAYLVAALMFSVFECQQAKTEENEF